jgi:hypothetical protein
MAANLEDKVLPGKSWHRRMQRTGYPAERADIIRMSGVFTSEGMTGGRS